MGVNSTIIIRLRSNVLEMGELSHINCSGHQIWVVRTSEYIDTAETFDSCKCHCSLRRDFTNKLCFKKKGVSCLDIIQLVLLVELTDLVMITKVLPVIDKHKK